MCVDVAYPPGVWYGRLVRYGTAAALVICRLIRIQTKSVIINPSTYYILHRTAEERRRKF